MGAIPSQIEELYTSPLPALVTSSGTGTSFTSCRGKSEREAWARYTCVPGIGEAAALKFLSIERLLGYGIALLHTQERSPMVAQYVRIGLDVLFPAGR